MADADYLDAERVRELLQELGQRLDAQGLHCRMFIVGGAAMALAYNRDRLTRDIDAVFEPKAVVYEEARRMADERNLPVGWLNDGAKGFMPGPDRGKVRAGLDAPGISVQVASPEYMFAMKAAAARSEQDHDDLVTLIDHLGIGSVDEAFARIEQYYPRQRLQPKTQFVIEEIVTATLDAREGGGHS